MSTSTAFQRAIHLKLNELNTYQKYLRCPTSTQQTRFALVCDYRSGSTLLANLLNQHPDIHCDDEIFSHFAQGKFNRVVWPYAYLHGKSSRSLKPIYGFDCKVDQFSQMGFRKKDKAYRFLKRLTDQSWKLIYLQREDTVKQALSNYIANQRGAWHDLHSSPLNRKKVKFDARVFASLLKTHEYYRKKLDFLLVGNNLPHLKVSYEKDLLKEDNHKATIKKICDYLDTSFCYAPATMNRVSSKMIENDLENVDALVTFLRSSRYDSVTWLKSYS